MLAYSPHPPSRLLVSQLDDHQSNMVSGVVPLLVLDMREHAYYPQYRTGKADYLDAFWRVVNWAGVQARYQAARAWRVDEP